MRSRSSWLPRGWWLLLVLPLLFALLGFLFIQQRGPEYSATATFRFAENQAVLVRTFESLVVSGPVLERVIAELDLQTDIPTLQEQIIGEKVLGTNLYQVSVTQSDPETSAVIANAVPQAFEDWYIETRTAELQEQLDALQPEIDSLQDAIEATEGEGRRDQLRSERNALLQRRQQILVEEARLADLLSLTVPAVAPAEPALLSSGLVPLSAAVLGLGLAIALVIFWEGLTPRIGGTREEVERATGLPVLGPIVSSIRPRVAGNLPVGGVESRYLGVRLRLLRSGDGIGRVVVTSAEQAEERGFLPIQLGLQLAGDGLRAVVVESSPLLAAGYEVLGVPAEPGLSSVLDDPSIDAAQLLRFVQLDGVEVAVLPPGAPRPPMPLDAARLGKVLADLNSVADVVVVGAGPVLTDPETLVLAAEATTTLVGARPGDTGMEALREASRRLAASGAEVLGVVLTTERPARS